MFPCQHLRTAQTRREMLQLCANGFGGLAFASLFANATQAASGAKPSHYPAKAKKRHLLVHGWWARVDGYL